MPLDISAWDFFNNGLNFISNHYTKNFAFFDEEDKVLNMGRHLVDDCTAAIDDLMVDKKKSSGQWFAFFNDSCDIVDEAQVAAETARIQPTEEVKQTAIQLLDELVNDHGD